MTSGTRFRIEWSADSVRPGVSRLSGTVHNGSGTTATSVRLNVDAVDATDRVLARYPGWVPGDLPGLSSRDFAVLEVPTVDRYRITVGSYTLIEAP